MFSWHLTIQLLEYLKTIVMSETITNKYGNSSTCDCHGALPSVKYGCSPCPLISLALLVLLPCQVLQEFLVSQGLQVAPVYLQDLFLQLLAQLAPVVLVGRCHPCLPSGLSLQEIQWCPTSIEMFVCFQYFFLYIFQSITSSKFAHLGGQRNYTE